MIVAYPYFIAFIFDWMMRGMYYLFAYDPLFFVILALGIAGVGFELARD